MNHLIFTKSLLSSISLVILFGMSNAVLAMEEFNGTRVKRDRGAKANPANYAECSDSLEDTKQKKKSHKKTKKNADNHPAEKRPTTNNNDKRSNPVRNTRGFYEGTNMFRINLPKDRLNNEQDDSYSFFLKHRSDEDRKRALFKNYRVQ